MVLRRSIARLARKIFSSLPSSLSPRLASPQPQTTKQPSLAASSRGSHTYTAGNPHITRKRKLRKTVKKERKNRPIGRAGRTWNEPPSGRVTRTQSVSPQMQCISPPLGKPANSWPPALGFPSLRVQAGGRRRVGLTLCRRNEAVKDTPPLPVVRPRMPTRGCCAWISFFLRPLQSQGPDGLGFSKAWI